MAKGKKSKKSDPRQAVRSAQNKNRRAEKFQKTRLKWLADTEYQKKQVEHQKKIVASKKNAKTENDNKST